MNLTERGTRSVAFLLAVTVVASLAGWMTFRDDGANAAFDGARDDSSSLRASPERSSATNQSPPQRSHMRTELVQADAASEVEWKVVSYQIEDQYCLSAVATSTVSADSGSLDNCWLEDFTAMRWGGGGVTMNHRWFNVAFGELPSAASKIEITAENGTQRDAIVSGDVWMLALPDDSPLGLAKAPHVIRAKGPSGQTIATDRLRLGEARRAATAFADRGGQH